MRVQFWCMHGQPRSAAFGRFLVKTEGLSAPWLWQLSGTRLSPTQVAHNHAPRYRQCPRSRAWRRRWKRERSRARHGLRQPRSLCQACGQLRARRSGATAMLRCGCGATWVPGTARLAAERRGLPPLDSGPAPARTISHSVSRLHLFKAT